MLYSNNKGLDRIADKMLTQTNLMHKLADLAGRKNYPGKLRKLQEKIQTEIELWIRKGPSAKLADLKKDQNFVQSQLNETVTDKERIDQLITKYSIGYGESNRSTT